MMTTVIGNLLDRAERAGAALVICDGQNRIVKVNKAHAQSYNFIEYATRPTFDQFLMRGIEAQHTADPLAYQDPHAWINTSARARQFCDYFQFITRRVDGKVFLVSYERVA